VPVALTPEQREHVEALLRRAKVEKRIYLRGRALLLMADGAPANRVAWTLRIHERTAEKWRRRFRKRRSGRDAGGRSACGAAACSLSDTVSAPIVAETCRRPEDVGVPVTRWSSASLLAEHLPSIGVPASESTVRRVLRNARLQPHRQKMRLHSQDDEFRRKRDAILRLYYETPADEHIICVDEKPGIQALERRYAEIPMKPGQCVRREFEYTRELLSGCV
jgi:transposase